MTRPFLIDRSDRLRMTFSGPQAKMALNGLLTNDVSTLTEGLGQYAAALTAKGRVVALCRVMDRGSELLVDTDAAAGAGFVAMIRKYVNPRLAHYAVVTDATACLAVRGVEAGAAILDAFAPEDGTTARTDLARLAPLGGCWLARGEMRLWVVRTSDTATPGLDCVGDRPTIDALRERLCSQGSAIASEATVRRERLEAGIPAFGVEMTEETLAQEACLDTLGAINFSKGCYTGQEVVARIHFRGHVNRLLRWVTSATPLAIGAIVVDPEGQEMGDVRSSVPRRDGGALSLAMVRREIAPGTSIDVRQADGAVIPAHLHAIIPGRSAPPLR